MTDIVIKNKIEWIDIAKGIGIFLVVLAHFALIYPANNIENQVYIQGLVRSIYLFHMPLFFFISGYLYHKEQNNMLYIVYQSLQLMVPYLAFFFLVIPVAYIFKLTDSVTIKDFTKHIWGGIMLLESLSTLLTPLWFLQCLYITRLFYNLLNTKIKNQYIIHFTIFLSLMSCYYLSIYKQHILLPFSLNMFLFAVVVYHLGFLYKRYEPKSNSIISSLLGIGAIIIALLIESNTVNMFINSYGIPFLTLFCSISVILLSKTIANYLTYLKPFKIIFSHLGEASLVIMALQFVVFFILRKAFVMNLLTASCLVTFICYILYRCFLLSKYTQILFLGKGISKENLRKLKLIK